MKQKSTLVTAILHVISGVFLLTPCWILLAAWLGGGQSLYLLPILGFSCISPILILGLLFAVIRSKEREWKVSAGFYLAVNLVSALLFWSHWFYG